MSHLDVLSGRHGSVRNTSCQLRVCFRLEYIRLIADVEHSVSSSNTSHDTCLRDIFRPQP